MISGLNTQYLWDVIQRPDENRSETDSIKMGDFFTVSLSEIFTSKHVKLQLAA